MEKTLGLLLIIGLGLALKAKIKSPDQLKGLKVLILSVALPATIFAALLNVEASLEMLLFPVVGLLINIGLFVVFHFTLKGSKDFVNSDRRTLLMLMPSLAPGLSCFPFISEYLGAESLALAALADVGNKVFVLIALYMLAMHWYYRKNNQVENPKGSKLKELVLGMLKEPINMVIILALVLLSFGINIKTLPESISSLILRLSSIMAPLVLLFIGMAVNIKRNDFTLILRMLLLRSGAAFLVSAVAFLLIPNTSPSIMLLFMVFAQSSASFWPFAHISLVNEMENGSKEKTFNVDLALSVLALSLPFSTFVILGIFSFPSIATNPIYPALIGGGLVFVFFLSPVLKFLRGDKEVAQEVASIQEHA